MWQGHIPGHSPPQGVPCSKELFDAVHRFADEKGVKIQFIFESSLIELWMIWNGGKEVNQPKSEMTQERVRRLLLNSTPPGKIPSHHHNEIYVRFTGDLTFEWFEQLEKASFIQSFASGIRRVFTYFMMKHGYLEPSSPIPIQTNEKAAESLESKEAPEAKIEEEKKGKKKRLASLFH